MKKFRFISLALVICMLFALAACNADSGTPSESTSDTIYGSVSASVSGSESASLSASASVTTSGSASSAPSGSGEPSTAAVDLRANSYLIIRPEGASSTVVQAAQALHAAMQTASLAGANDLKDDWIKRGTEPPAYEILCGACDRVELDSFSAPMRVDDFVVAVSGTKVVLIGGSDQATADAINYFTSNYISAGLTALNAGTLHQKQASYPIMNFSIGGHDISEYTILYATDDYSKMVAEALQKELVSLTGYMLPLLAGTQSESSNKDTEILVGKTTRNLTNSLGAKQYQFAIKNSKVHLECGTDIAVGYAVQAFLDSIADKRNGTSVSFGASVAGAVTSIASGMPICSFTTGSSLRLMTYNLLADAGTVASRADHLRSVILDYLPDVIGMQEVNANQHSYVVNYLKQNGYTLATVASGNGSYTPILYRTSKYTKVTSGAEMLRSRYKGTNTKSIAWVVLEEKSTGKRFAVINSHYSLILDSYNDAQLKQYNGLTAAQLTPEGRAETALAWRCDNAAQALEIMASLRKSYGATLPVFVMGDLNMSEGSASFKVLTDGGMDNCKYLSNTRDNGETHHELGTTLPSGGTIDHILVTKGSAKVYLHDIVRNNNSVNGSDHFPVFCDIKLN